MAISNKINQSFDEKKSRISIKYILAEIFLITAGILIALGIDNWNNNRIEQNEVDKYLIEIKKELEIISNGALKEKNFLNKKLMKIKEF